MKHSFQFDSCPFLAFPPSLRESKSNRIDSPTYPSRHSPPSLAVRSFTHFRPDAQKICSHRRYKSRSPYIITASSPSLSPFPRLVIYSTFLSLPPARFFHAAVQSSSCLRALSLALVALLRFPAESQHEPSVVTSTSYPAFRQWCPGTSSKTDLTKLSPP
jgi:hypothetical protein